MAPQTYTIGDLGIATFTLAYTAVKTYTGGDLRFDGGGAQTLEPAEGGIHIGDAYQYDETVDGNSGLTNPSDTDKIVINGQVPHNGLRDTGIVVRASAVDQNGFHVIDYTEINDIALSRQGVAAGIIIGLLIRTNVKVNRVLIYDQFTINDNFPGAIEGFSFGGDNEIFNCAIMNCGSLGTGTVQANGIFVTGGTKIYNTSIINITHAATVPGAFTGVGIHMRTGTITITNTVVCNSTVNDFVLRAATTAVVNYGISSDASILGPWGANNLLNKLAANQFVTATPGSEDVHLKEGADCIRVGADLSGDFTDDFEGDTRVDYNTGADEFGISGTPYYYNKRRVA